MDWQEIKDQNIDRFVTFSLNIKTGIYRSFFFTTNGSQRIIRRKLELHKTPSVNGSLGHVHMQVTTLAYKSHTINGSAICCPATFIWITGEQK